MKTKNERKARKEVMHLIWLLFVVIVKTFWVCFKMVFIPSAVVSAVYYGVVIIQKIGVSNINLYINMITDGKLLDGYRFLFDGIKLIYAIPAALIGWYITKALKPNREANIVLYKMVLELEDYIRLQWTDESRLIEDVKYNSMLNEMLTEVAKTSSRWLKKKIDALKHYSESKSIEDITECIIHIRKVLNDEVNHYSDIFSWLGHLIAFPELYELDSAWNKVVPIIKRWYKARKLEHLFRTAVHSEIR